MATTTSKTRSGHKRRNAQPKTSAIRAPPTNTPPHQRASNGNRPASHACVRCERARAHAWEGESGGACGRAPSASVSRRSCAAAARRGGPSRARAPVGRSVNLNRWMDHLPTAHPNPSECGGVASRLCCLGSGASHEWAVGGGWCEPECCTFGHPCALYVVCSGSEAVWHCMLYRCTFARCTLVALTSVSRAEDEPQV